MCVYRFISPSGKSYVGQARNYIDRQKNRIKDYNKWLKIKDDESRSERERRGSNPRLFLAFLKYGIDNFYSEILEENIDCQENLDARENYWIEYYNCIKKGYNVVIGGSFGINPDTGRSYCYGKSKYDVSCTDNPSLYERVRYKYHREEVIKKKKAYLHSHPEMLKKIHAKHRDYGNKRRRESNKFFYRADKEYFVSVDIAKCYRRFFGGGRTRAYNFVTPRGCVNEQLCWLFEL